MSRIGERKMMKTVHLFAGTRKGGLILSSDERREQWEMSELHFKGWKVMHMGMDPRDHRLHAAVDHTVFGPSTHYSDDLGTHWTQAEGLPEFTEPSTSGRPVGTAQEARDPQESIKNPEEVLSVWKIQPGRSDEPHTLFAGVEPAALFISRDRGKTWEINKGLYNHPHRPQWYPSKGGLALHSILPHPTDRRKMWVGISTGGCYYTNDGGKTWNPRNQNVLADFHPEKYPEFGQCPHKITMHPQMPHRLYQQNHCGVYRSDDGGKQWIDIGEGKLPSRFGYPILVHPHDPDTVYVIPEEGDQFRYSANAAFEIWRSRDKGQSWRPLTKGLPDRAYVVVLREAMAADSCGQAGIYAGTKTGEIFYSLDDGQSWDLLADYLPPIYSLDAISIEG